MKISTSFLSSKNIPRDLTILNDTDVDYIHVDVMDGKFVKNKTMPFKEMKNIYKFTSKRLDVHLMVAKPYKYIKNYASLNTEYLTIHAEVEEDVGDLLNLIKSYGIKCGLSIKPTSDLELLRPYLSQVDLILVMAVEPGQGGQEFLPDTVERIKQIKKMLKDVKSKALLSVDGGINADTKKLIGTAVDILVSGSYVTNSNNFQDAIDTLR